MSQQSLSTKFKKYLFHASALLLISACGNKETTYSFLPDSAQFTQSASEYNGKIDILWVMDNSGSMGTSQTNIASNFQAFISQFAANNYDFRIAVTTTEAYLKIFTGNAAISRYRSTGPTGNSGVTILAPTTPGLEQKFIYNIRQGTSGSGDERAFQSLKSALQDSTNLNDGFPRKDAYLAIVVVSDEDDFSTDATTNISGGANPYADPRLHPIQTYIDFLDKLTASTSAAARRYSVNSISIFDSACLAQIGGGSQRIGTRYATMADLTEGMKLSLCGNFANSLTQLSKSIIELSSLFYLARIPNEASISVRVNNVIVPHDSTNGWIYVAQKNAVQFKGSAVPPQGAKILIDFDPTTL